MDAFRRAPCGPLRGRLRVPGDKSVTHRGLMLLALAEGEGRLFYPLKAGDTLSTARVLQALGAEVREEGPHFLVRGRGLRFQEPEDVLDCGNAGTLMRLLLGLLAALVTALVTVRWMLAFVARHGFRPFALYRMALAAVYAFFFLR